MSVDESGGIFTDTESTTLDGGAGNDSLTGGSGVERFLGGPGDDFVRGGRGNDIAMLGDDNDTFVWNPGEGSDIVEGENGTDAMLFNGANVNEKIDLSANGSRVRFTRDVANITMDLNGVEVVDFNALGGSDTVTVNDLTGTDVTDVNTDLAAVPGSGTGDAAADNVIVNGTAVDDKLAVSGANGEADVTGGPAAVHVFGGEPALDTLTRERSEPGTTRSPPTRRPAHAIHVIADGGTDNDTVIDQRHPPRRHDRHRARRFARGRLQPRRRRLLGECGEPAHQRAGRKGRHHRKQRPGDAHAADHRRRRAAPTPSPVATAPTSSSAARVRTW